MALGTHALIANLSGVRPRTLNRFEAPYEGERNLP